MNEEFEWIGRDWKLELYKKLSDHLDDKQRQALTRDLEPLIEDLLFTAYNAGVNAEEDQWI